MASRPQALHTYFGNQRHISDCHWLWVLAKSEEPTAKGQPAILGATAHVADYSGLFQLSRGRFLRLLARRALSPWGAGGRSFHQLLFLRPLGFGVPRHHSGRFHLRLPDWRRAPSLL